MKIEGLDYNTQRERLVLPEYGRVIQEMVDYAVGLPTKAERQRAAEGIIDVMRHSFPQGRNSEGYEQKLWDHLAIMSNFRLDIDYPFDVSQALQMAKKPEAMEYPMKEIPVRHYGSILFGMFDRLKKMPAGAERDELVRVTANQMRRNLLQWSTGSAADEKVAEDLARYTDGVIQIDLDNFRFNKVPTKDSAERRRRRR